MSNKAWKFRGVGPNDTAVGRFLVAGEGTSRTRRNRLTLIRQNAQGEITHRIEFGVTHHDFFIPNRVSRGVLRQAQILAGRIGKQWSEDFLRLLEGVRPEIFSLHIREVISKLSP